MITALNAFWIGFMSDPLFIVAVLVLLFFAALGIVAIVSVVGKARGTM